MVEHLLQVERCSDLVSQHSVPLQWDQKVAIHGLITLDILDQVICVIVLTVAILNLTPSARDPDCPPKFLLLTLGVHYQDQESK